MIELWYSLFSLFNKCDCQTWLSWFSQELLFWHLGSRPRKTVEEEETGGSAKFVPYGQTSTVFAQVVVKSTGHHQEVLLKRVFAPPKPWNESVSGGIKYSLTNYSAKEYLAWAHIY